MNSSSQYGKQTMPAHIEFSQRLNADIRYNLSDSTAQTMTVSELCSLADTNIGQIPLSYGSLMASSALRQAILAFHTPANTSETMLDEDNVLTFCGAQEALAAIYQSILQPGDEVVLLTPCYPSLRVMAENMGCVVNPIKLSSSHAWQVTIDSFLPLVNEKTKLIVVNSPHNPSGSVIDSALAEQLLALAKQYNCYILADDVSQASNYNNLPLAHQYLTYQKAIVVSVLSKSFGLAGVRVGWTICQDRGLVKQLLANKCYGSICCSAVDLFLAEIALTHRRTITEKNNLIIKNNIEIVQKFIDRNKRIFSWHPPQAGLLAIVKCHFQQPVELWAKHIAQSCGVLILPTSLFGLPGQYFRLGLGQQNLSNGLDALQVCINSTTELIVEN
jgi:aspartate/methionine/tyrosine aminotransferase